MRILILMALFLGACTKKADKAPPTPAERGRSVFASHCTACHNMNPKAEGVLGPSVHGSSLELVEARVVRAAYPEGYTPKRNTKVMVPLPMLKDEIQALHAYLNQP
jgi:mono/diheme cytochrome c family protein